MKRQQLYSSNTNNILKDDDNDTAEIVEKRQRLQQEDSNSYGEKVVDFLIIGAQKAGTMAAVKNLNKHHECHFFDLYWNMGLKWYLKQLKSTKRFIGEKTPELIYVDDCALRIKQVCPNAKFILFLRDPIKRAFSSWNMQTSRGQENLPFDECIERELTSMMNEMRSFGTAEYHYLQKGFYMDQIERFSKVFPNRDQMLIVIAEYMKAEPQREYQKIFDFLGASPQEIEAEEDHVGSYSSKLGPRMIEKLRLIFEPHNKRLFQYLGFDIPEWHHEPLITDSGGKSKLKKIV